MSTEASKNVAAATEGKTIARATLPGGGGRLVLTFTDGSSVEVFVNGMGFPSLTVRER